MKISNVGQKKSSAFKIKDFSVAFEGVGKTGEFSGYASVFGNLDLARETVAPGAFSETIKELKASGAKLPALWNHRSDEPLGYYSSLEEDERGLKVTGKLLVETVSRAKEIASLVDEGAVSGLSIGYWVKDESFDHETRITTLKELKLREISLCTFPCNEEARIEAIKCQIANGTLPSAKDFERLLREAGFSRSLSTRIAAKGYCSVIGQGEPDHQSAALDEIRKLRNRFS